MTLSKDVLGAEDRFPLRMIFSGRAAELIDAQSHEVRRIEADGVGARPPHLTPRPGVSVHHARR